MIYRFIYPSLFAVLLAGVCLSNSATAYDHWKREISYQSKNDLFYNYQVGPNPSGTAAEMYISPRPVPPFVGHTYTTYQPFMPHEMMYRHHRSHYAHQPGAGWSRSKIRYKTFGLRWQHMVHNISSKY